MCSGGGGDAGGAGGYGGAQVRWDEERAGGATFPQRVALVIGSEAVEVTPMWISVLQHHEGASARWAPPAAC